MAEDEAQAGEVMGGEGEEQTPFFVEAWNDYDPSQRFTVIFPVGADQGAQGSSVAYYIIEPGKHTGVHSDNAEEVAFIAEGEGEAFMLGGVRKLVAGSFVVFGAGQEHDVYAQGGVALRLLSFFPTTEIVSTFQQVLFPVGSAELSSLPPKQTVTEVTADELEGLPGDFPFALDELGLSPQEEPPPRQGLSSVQRAIGMTEEDSKPAAEEGAEAADATGDAEEPESDEE